MNYLAKIEIKLREGILDVQGKTVERALHSIDYPMITDVKIGKFVELKVQADNASKAMEFVESACSKLIANPIIEDYLIDIEEIKG